MYKLCAQFLITEFSIAHFPNIGQCSVQYFPSEADWCCWFNHLILKWLLDCDGTCNEKQNKIFSANSRKVNIEQSLWKIRVSQLRPSKSSNIQLRFCVVVDNMLISFNVSTMLEPHFLIMAMIWKLNLRGNNLEMFHDKNVLVNLPCP